LFLPFFLCAFAPLREIKKMWFIYLKIAVIGHSAGGWISRIYMGEKPYLARGDLKPSLWEAHPLVATLITLGTPHISQERWTRSNLDFVTNNYPGAFYSKVRYVCVVGKTIFGQRRRGSWLAYSSYQLTCGKGNTWGDGITPIEAAHLEGAENLVIEGVKHSPRTLKSLGGIFDLKNFIFI
jgi:triacylglycerol esterase/lipase EstA (alpha/beta hydrolase family)